MMSRKYPKGVPFCSAPREMLERPDLSFPAKFLYLLLDGFSGYPSICPGIKRLAKKANRSPRWVFNAIANLESAGWATVHRRKGQSNNYVLTRDPKLCDEIAYRYRQRRQTIKPRGAKKKGLPPLGAQLLAEGGADPRTTVRHISALEKESEIEIIRKNRQSNAEEYDDKANAIPDEAVIASNAELMTWEAVIHLAERLLPRVCGEELQIWLMETCDTIILRDAFFTDRVECLQSLIGKSLTSIAAVQDRTDSEIDLSPDDLKHRISEWVRDYGKEL